MSEAITLNQVTPKELAVVLEASLESDVPIFTWGHPGIGKSDIHAQVAEKHGRPLIDLRASQLDAVDTRGAPFVKNGTTRWAIPDVFPTDPDSNAIIFLDELNAAPPLVQAALYQLIVPTKSGRRLGDYKVPQNVRIFAAGNFETDRSVTSRMSTALANRFCHVGLVLDVDQWVSWAIDADIDLSVISYIRWRPENLHKWDARSASKAQATPRSFEFLSRVVKTLDAQGITGRVATAMICGCVGDAVGSEFVGFRQDWLDMPDPDGIIMNPKGADIPASPSKRYAIALALAARSTRANFDRVLTYADRLEQAGGVEYSTALVQVATAKKKELNQTKAFIAWATAHPDVFI